MKASSCAHEHISWLWSTADEDVTSCCYKAMMADETCTVQSFCWR